MTQEENAELKPQEPRAPLVHEVKCHPPYFQDVWIGRKPFEVRKKDRDYRVGDSLHLREWLPETEEYTGRWCIKRITYILDGGAFGIEEGYCVMAIL